MKFRILLLSTLFHSAEGKYYSLSGSLNVINVLTRRQALHRFAAGAPINEVTETGNVLSPRAVCSFHLTDGALCSLKQGKVALDTHDLIS